MQRLRTTLLEVLLATGLLIGVLWGVVWADLLGGPQEVDVAAPAGLQRTAALSALGILLPLAVALAAWPQGRVEQELLGRGAVLLVGLGLLTTARGWERVPGADGATVASVVAGLALLGATLPRSWTTGVRRGLGPRSRLRFLLLVPLSAVVVVGASTAWSGWTLRVVNRPEEGENGWPFLAGGAAAVTLALVLADLLLRRRAALTAREPAAGR